jgi:hypothetical protein
MLDSWSRHPLAPMPRFEEQTKTYPEELIQLNLKRQATGSAEFQRYKRTHMPPAPRIKDVNLARDPKTLKQLVELLGYIIQATPFEITQSNRVKRKSNIIRWVQQFDQLLDSQVSKPSLSGPALGNDQVTRPEDIAEFMVRFNSSIDKSDAKIRSILYEAFDLAGMDDVLDKLQALTRSVRVQKEVEEFEDERLAWRSRSSLDHFEAPPS